MERLKSRAKVFSELGSGFSVTGLINKQGIEAGMSITDIIVISVMWNSVIKMLVTF